MTPLTGLLPEKLGPVSLSAIALVVAAIVIVAVRSTPSGTTEYPRVAEQVRSLQDPPHAQREEPAGGKDERASRRISEPVDPVVKGETDSPPPETGTADPRPTHPVAGGHAVPSATLPGAQALPPASAPLPPPRSGPGVPSTSPHQGAPTAVQPTPQLDPRTTPTAVKENPPSQSEEEDPPPSEDEPPSEDDPGSDHTAPVLDSLRFDPPEVPDGGATNLLIYASDDLSGIKAASGMLSSPSGSSMPRFTAQKQADGSFAARITIPKDAESGNWFVFAIEVIDGADNPLAGTFSTATVPAGGTLIVSSSASDSTPPRVRSAAVQYRSLPSGEKNVISILVDDDQSGVAEVTGAFQGPSGSATIMYTCSAGNSDFWEGDVPIPANAECGLWKLYQIKVVDKAGNSAYLMNNSPIVAGVAFTVSGGGPCDSTPPALESFSVSPTVVSNERATEIVATATVRDEDSGTQSMYGWFTGPASSSGEAPKVFFSCTPGANAADSSWTCKGIVQQNAAKGTWKTGLVRLLDKAQNQRDYNLGDPALVQGTFEVQ